MIFTAGTYDLPRAFYEQMKAGGLLLIVIKDSGGGDNLFLLRKVDTHFESVYSMPCGFVQMSGKHQQEGLDPVVLEAFPEWPELRRREIARRPFWWGSKGGSSMWQTLGIRSFLGITEPFFRAFKLAKANAEAPDQYAFGLWDREHDSLVIARDDELILDGNRSAALRLLTRVHEWVDLGMPTASSFHLDVHQSDRAPAPTADQWVVKRDESQFVWSLRPV